MNPKELEAIRFCRQTVRKILRNQLTYPKVIASLAKDRRMTSEEASKINQCVDECILMIESELASLLWNLEHKKRL